MKKLGQGTHFTKPGASQAQKLWISMKKRLHWASVLRGLKQAKLALA